MEMAFQHELELNLKEVIESSINFEVLQKTLTFFNSCPKSRFEPLQISMKIGFMESIEAPARQDDISKQKPSRWFD